MKIIDMIELSECEDIKINSVFAINQRWTSGSVFVMKNPRPQSAFLWFRGASGAFIPRGGEMIEVPRGALVYIPESAQYEVRFFECTEEVSTVLVEFRLFDDESFVLSDGIRIIYDCTEDVRITVLLERLVYEYSLPSKSRLKLKRDIFGLLSYIFDEESKKRIDVKGLKTIEKGIEYLQKDEKQELSIEEIARTCFVTPSYFRRLFREYAGISPQEYRISRKIERAKELIERSDISVDELSKTLGYNDPSYFCRAFKKMTGLTPTEYKKRFS